MGSESRTDEFRLPLPPFEMRTLVGPTDDEQFDNPSGELVFRGIDPDRYVSVLDFGCGCGRVARQMIQQHPRPRRYAGLDLHPGMIRWCQENLAPHAPGFTFSHHDVRYDPFNPGRDKPLCAPFQFAAGEFTLVVAISVFTHLTQDQAEHYLAEVARVLDPEGVFESTWFLFDKRDFPMMQDDQSTLFINDLDIRNAEIYDRAWLPAAAAKVGLAIFEVQLPTIRGFHWHIRMTPMRPGVATVEIPDELGERGRKPPPTMPPDADRIGLH